MIDNNVQFTSKNPIKMGQKGLEVAEKAIASYKATQGNIDMKLGESLTKALPRRMTQAEVSAARARRPAGVNIADLPAVDEKMIQRAESYGVSHGSVGVDMDKCSIDYLA